MSGLIIGVVVFMAALAVGGIVRYLLFWQAREVPFFPENRMLCLAHRGVPSRAPENTLPAFQEAFNAGVDCVELDVMETADGVLIVRHDYHLEEDTEGSGYVWEQPYAAIAKLNAAHRWGDKFPATPIPRLEDILKELPEDVLINIELKIRHWFNPGFEEKVIAMIRQHRLVRRTIVSSFSPLSLVKLRRLEPELALGYLWRDTRVPWYLRRPYFVNLVHPDVLHPHVIVTTPKAVDRAHRRGMKVNVWTVNNRPMIQYLESIGVDGIFTDFPELVLRVNRA
ncbi:MAG: hypothetical protein JSU77_11385 [Fidelibacterota bacterium]|nr:MAG: hypothetical protein JSU77_11385 [Candidatus Neomarinimicrobiota bacterium]